MELDIYIKHNMSSCKYHSNHIQNAYNSGVLSSNRRLERIRIYLENPKYCLYCKEIISYDKKINNFCNRSCSRSYHNVNQTLSYETKQKISQKRRQQSIIPSSKYKIRYESNPKICKYCYQCISYDNRKKQYCSDVCRTSQRKYNAIHISKLGGNRNKHSGWYHSKIAGLVYLESSYELFVAKELDNNNINWKRPKYIKYISDKIVRRYYPDFYLIDYNIYLDPKNKFLIEKDKDKINTVINQNNVKILVLDKDSLTWLKILEKINACYA